MRAIDPIFVSPRFVEHEWGRDDIGEWAKLAPHRPACVAEVWIHDAANLTDHGLLGRRLAANSAGMLGDIGRAPPRLRLVFPGRYTEVASTAPVSFWTLLEPGFEDGRSINTGLHRPGERVRAYEGAAIALPPQSVALEVSSAFQPANAPIAEGPSRVHLPPVSRRARATLTREDSLSVEMWSLPEWSRLVPDGETCHVVTALSEGVLLDGRRLFPGQSVFIPAFGRPVDLLAQSRASKILVAYPDQTPTAIWRHTPGPDPMGGLLPKPEPAHPPLAASNTEPALAA